MPTAYTCVTPGATALLCTGVPVAATGDTINGNDVLNGAVLIVTAGGTPTNVTFVDPGHTPAGTTAGSVTPVTVAANTSKAFGRTQLAGYIDPVANTVSPLYSSITAITAQVVA
jgi:hypothetical protein